MTTPALVLVLGKTGVGKSTFVKTATGLDTVEIGQSLEPCTAEVQIYPVPDSQLFLIDTPGFDDPRRSDTDILQSIASCLADLYEGLVFDGKQISLSGIIFVHAINEPRMTGAMMKNLRMLEHVVGKVNSKQLMFVTSKWTKEHPRVAHDRESELMEDRGFWRESLLAGAMSRRFEDSKGSAIEILNQVTTSGMFLPKLTTEYVIDGMELYRTNAGRAIDEDLARARDKNEADLTAIRQRFGFAREAHDAESTSKVRLLEAQLRVLDDEVDQLRLTRERAQEREDDLDPLITKVMASKGSLTPEEAKRRARKKRAARWLGRFAAMGAAVAMSVLTHGAMVPVGISLYAAVETLCQADKDREVQKKLGV